MTNSQSRSHVSRWFMIVSLLAMAVTLTLFGLQLRKSGLKGTPATLAATAPAESATPDGSGASHAPPADDGAPRNN